MAGGRSVFPHGDGVFVAQAVDFILRGPVRKILGGLHRVAHAGGGAEHVALLDGGIGKRDVFQVRRRAEVAGEGGWDFSLGENMRWDGHHSQQNE